MADGSISLSGASVTIEAAKDRKLSDVTAMQGDGTRSRGMEADETLSGGVVGAGKNLTIVANGRNAGEGSITATGANLSAGGQATLVARNDVTLQNATTEHSTLSESHSERSGLLSSSSSTANSSARSTLAEGSNLGADTVRISAGNDINVKGSNIISDTGTTLAAGNNVTIEAAQNTSSQSSFKEEKKSGFGALGGLSYGKREQSSDMDSTATTAVASTVGAVSGNVNITAGNQYTQTGSDVLAPRGDVNIVAKTVAITNSGSMGIGSDSGSASSVTQAAISGIAGNKDARTGDAEAGIQKIFDATRVQKEIDAQIAITAEFGRLASQAVGDYAQKKLNEATVLREQASNEPNEERKSALKAQAKELEDNWGNTGVLRVALHTVIGGLTGGAGGAAGAAAGTLTAPTVAQAKAMAVIERERQLQKMEGHIARHPAALAALAKPAVPYPPAHLPAKKPYSQHPGIRRAYGRNGDPQSWMARTMLDGWRVTESFSIAAHGDAGAKALAAAARTRQLLQAGKAGSGAGAVQRRDVTTAK